MQRLSQSRTWFSRRTFMKSRLNFEKNIKISSTEDEHNVSSETLDFDAWCMLLDACFEVFGRRTLGHMLGGAEHDGYLFLYLFLLTKTFICWNIFILWWFSLVLHFLVWFVFFYDFGNSFSYRQNARFLKIFLIAFSKSKVTRF